MSYVTNVGGAQSRIFEKDKSGDFQRDFMIDNSNMNKDIEKNMGNFIASSKHIRKRPKPIYDFKTKNLSFVNLYNDLYRLGIKNNKFFLRLYDKDLIGIDPYQKILPIDLQLKIIYECIINPWYFLREVCRIPEDGSPIEIGGGTQYKIDRNNLASWYLFLNGVDNYQSKPRQTGKTQDALAKLVYAYHFGTLSAQFLFFNKDQGLGKTNLYRFKCQRDMLPEYMQMKFIIDEAGKIDKGIDNITTMRNPITGNTITVMPKATSKDAAIKLGRGNTAAIHHYDECDFTPWIDEIINAAAFSYSKASENAKKNGSLFGRLYTSTPGDVDQRDGKAMVEYISKMLRWRDEYLDLPINQLKKIVNGAGYNRVVYVEHSWKQLKLSMDWYEKQCGLVSFKEDVILREIELQRISGSSLSPFKRKDLLYMNNHKREPIETIDYSKNLCPILLYEKLNRATPYILAIDPSEGLSLDNNAFTLINPYTQMVAAEFRSPYISPPDYVKLCIKFMDDRCPKSMIVIEANRGRELINRFLESKYRYQVWYDIDKLNSKIVDTTDEYGALRQAAHERRAYGFDTTPSSRPKLFSILENFVEEQIDKLVSQYVVEDIMGLIRKTNGKIEAASGKHDDNIMSYLIGLYVYFHASNLEDFGIIRGATEPQIIDENDPSVIKERMLSMMGSLPNDLKEVFKDFMEEKDIIDEAWDYEREIQREMTRYNHESDNDDISFNEANDMIWNGLSDAVFESNFNDDDFNVNIEDYIDY